MLIRSSQRFLHRAFGPRSNRKPRKRATRSRDRMAAAPAQLEDRTLLSAITYSTFLGGSGSEAAGVSLAVDKLGNTYVAGTTTSPDFPVTSGAFDTTFTGGDQPFIAKFNASGALVWATFLGGTSDQGAHAIAVDSAGSVYVTGTTNSSNFPTTPGAYQTNYPGGQTNLFVAKLNATGSALLYSTFIGGSGVDFTGNGQSIAVDAEGDVYLTGCTQSSNFPTTPGAFQTTFSNVEDTYVLKLNPTGSALVYSTFLGSSNSRENDAQGDGIAVDSSGDAYVVGSADAANFPTTPGAFQTSDPGGTQVVVTELNPSGTGLVYSTYLGGTGGGNAQAWGVAIDASGNAYIDGFTNDQNLPTTAGAFQATYNPGGYDGFVAKLNSTGSALDYLTYLGENQSNAADTAIAIDSSGDAYLTGLTSSASFPTVNAFQPNYGGGPEDAFVTELNPTGTAAVFSSFLGGSGDDDAFGIGLNSAGNVCVAGYTDSPNFPTTPDAFQTTLNGAYNAFLTMISPNSSGQTLTPTVTVTDGSGTYNGQPFSATATVAGTNGVPGSSLEGVGLTLTYYVGTGTGGTQLPGAPSSAGSYTVEASFAGSTDYVPASATAMFTISQAMPTVTVSDGGGTYNGSSFPATATVAGVVPGVDNTPAGTLEGVGLTLTYYVGTGTGGTQLPGAPSSAGSYTVEASFAGSTDYVPASATATFTISQAVPTVTVTDAGGTYNGNPFPASAAATGVGGASVSGSFAFIYYVGNTASGSGTSAAPANPGTYTVVADFTSTNANYTNAQSAPLTFTINVNLGLLLLDPSGSAALDDAGSGTITVSGGGAIAVDSSSPTAAIISGSGSVEASQIDVTGGTETIGSGRFSSPILHPTPIADPLGLTLPPAPSTSFAAVNYSGVGTLTLSPGTYVGGIKLSGSGSIKLEPGVYYLEGGGLSVVGSGSITGSGVLLINAPSKSTDSISLTGSGSLTLSPSSSLTGIYASDDGITILQNPASAAPITIDGSGGLTINGVLYAPKAPLDIAGSGGLLVNPDSTYGRAEVIVSDLKDTGSGSVTINVDSPTVKVSTPVTVSVPGEPVPLVIQVSDVSSLAQAAAFTFTISFGDGDTKTFTGTGPLVVNHVYAQTGTFAVEVTATDEFGYTSVVATQKIVVATAALEMDPFNTSQTALFVGVPSGNETIDFNLSCKNIAVTVNGASEGTFSTSGPLIVFGQGSTDIVNEGSGLTNSISLLQSPTVDNLETDLDNEAIQWAGLTAAVEILNA